VAEGQIEPAVTVQNPWDALRRIANPKLDIFQGGQVGIILRINHRRTTSVESDQVGTAAS